MLLILILLALILLILATGFLLWQRRHRAGQGKPVTVEALWQGCLTASLGAEYGNFLAQLEAADREAVHDSLREFEVTLRDEADPMLALRRELMDSMDRRLLNLEILKLPEEVKRRLRANNSEMMQSDAQAQTYIVANDLRMALLREYAAQRFGDRNQGDWFDVYCKASRLKQRGARNFIERTLAGSQSNLDDARYQTMTLVDNEIRARLLKVPAGAQFPGFEAEAAAMGGQSGELR